MQKRSLINICLSLIAIATTFSLTVILKSRVICQWRLDKVSDVSYFLAQAVR